MPNAENELTIGDIDVQVVCTRSKRLASKNALLELLLLLCSTLSSGLESMITEIRFPVIPKRYQARLEEPTPSQIATRYAMRRAGTRASFTALFNRNGPYPGTSGRDLNYANVGDAACHQRDTLLLISQRLGYHVISRYWARRTGRVRR